MDRHQRDRRVSTLNSRPLLYCITGGWGAAALSRIREAALAGVDLIQIREKAMPARDLFDLCRRARLLMRGTSARLLVNDRWDIALAAGIDGVHLPAAGLPAAALRLASPPGFIIGQSCHSTAEVNAAAGVDFCVLGPIFSTPSKLAFGPPLGLSALRHDFPHPVLALGGVNVENAAACLAAGAAGVAGIRLFVSTPTAPVTATVAQLQQL